MNWHAVRCVSIRLAGSLPLSQGTVHLAHRTVISKTVSPLRVVAQESSSSMVRSSPEISELSPFLQALLDPPETVALEDATRTYSTMDVVEPCHLYDPKQTNRTATGNLVEEGPSGDEPRSSLSRAHAAGQLWRHFSTSTVEEVEANRPPKWFESLCKDLFYRTNSNDELDEVAALSDPLRDSISDKAEQANGWISAPDDDEVVRADLGATDPVDPYLFLSFELIDEREYAIGPYCFPDFCTYSHEQRTLLCLGDVHKEYVHFCDAYPFPERYQVPTSVGTKRCKLYVDPRCPAQVVYIQLAPEFPPAAWLPVKGTAASLRRVLGEFAQHAALHRDWHHGMFEERYATARRVMKLQRLPIHDEGDVLRFLSYEARNTQFIEAPIREFPNQQEFFLGEYDDPEKLLEHIDLCPFLFSIPHMRTVVDPHAEHMTPTISGPGVAPSLYRCIFSKALILIQVQLSAEVKLPPQDPEGFHFLWKDSQVVPKMRIPVFARIVWPTNEKMSAGGLLNQRWNRLFGTEFAPDIPIDAVMTLFYTMNWAKELDNFLGVRGMRQRVLELSAAVHVPEPLKLYPGTREIPNPEYTSQERLGMHIQYLSQLGDPDIVHTIEAILPNATAAVRMGCAKAALIAGERALFRRIVASEPPGRMQLYMTKLVRKRKTRDLVDPEPRLLDEQFEFASPLWTNRGTRVDPNTLEGAVDVMQLRR